MEYKNIVRNISKILDATFFLETSANKYMSDEYKENQDRTLCEINNTLEKLVNNISLNLFNQLNKL